MTLDSILLAISSEGWQVRAMGQLSLNHWYATLHLPSDDGLYITPDCRAPTMTLALALAYAAIPSARFLPYTLPGAAPAPSTKLDLSALGLGTRPAPTFTLAQRLRPR